MELKSWQKGVEAVCTWLRCRRTILVGSLTFSDDQPVAVLIIVTPGIPIQVSTPARPQTHWEAAETPLLWSVSAVKETIRLIIAFFFYWPPLHSGFQALLRPQCWAQQQCTGDPWVPASSHWAGRQSPTAPSFNMKFSFNRFSLFFSMLIVTSAMIRKMTTSRIGKS